MRENNRRSLPDWIEDGYEILLEHIDDSREGIERERAYEVLLKAKEFPDEPRDTEYGLERLLDRGYFYQVCGDLRVTEPESDGEPD